MLYNHNNGVLYIFSIHCPWCVQKSLYLVVLLDICENAEWPSFLAYPVEYNQTANKIIKYTLQQERKNLVEVWLIGS